MGKKSNCNGFTLVELLVYLALFSFLITGVLVGVYQIIDSTDKISGKIFVEQEGNFLLRKINWALTGASSIVVMGSPPSLSINRPDLPAEQNPLLFGMDDSGSYLQLKRGNGSFAFLNSDNSKITDLQFTHSLSPESVKASFKINGQQFEITKYLRK